MSNNKMLIDATHPEETRVVVLRDNRVEEFDYESAARKLLRGSIYLAKITRVEPSLQAAFVDYGGNRHGFLAFSEIHPDYYQIPHADRQALLDEELAEQRRLREADEREDEADEPAARPARAAKAVSPDDELNADDGTDDADDAEDGHEATTGDEAANADHDDAPSTTAGTADEAEPTGETSAEASSENDDEADQRLTDSLEAGAIDVTAYLPPEQPSDDIESPAGEPEGDHEPETAAATASDDDGEPDPATIALDRDESEDVRRSAPVDAFDETHVHISADNEDSVDDDEDEDDEVEEVESFNDNTADDEDEVQAVRQVTARGDDEDDFEESPRAKPRAARPRRRARQYKIQEVVKRRQIVLIQVVKEERGNKGAALTTYLSLAGRYTVLMPNTARGGGISRKITNVQDRKRLKAIAQELDVPEGMGLIIRTAGAARTKQEIKRDFEYLLRLWENVRSLTLESTAPSLVYEEGNLIKRSIRDLYTKDIDEVVVAGEEAYKEAKGFMKMLMPSHAKNVVLHTDDQSLFARHRIEQQLNAMFSPVVQLRSGGYLVINQTEALVAVDVNSGKATREFSIEETALKTNLEASEELSRQLKLRDLAGLIVVDFIDMDEKRNNRAVERKLKECLRHDRARIQVGRISHFGLLEMSRQRLRTGVLEGSTMPCPHCQGSGMVRSTESVSLAVLRGLEDNFLAGKVFSCAALCAPDVASYLLNQKRAFIQDLERRYAVVIHVRASDKHQGANFAIEPLGEEIERLVPARRDAVNIDAGFEPRTADNDDQTQATNQRPSPAPSQSRAPSEENEEGAERRPRRRRRRGARRDDESQTRDRVDEPEYELETDDEAAVEATAAPADADDDGDEQTGEGGERRSRRSRRRGRRGGRRHREQRETLTGVALPGADQPDAAHAEMASGATAPTSPEAAATEADATEADTGHVAGMTAEMPADAVEGFARPLTAAPEDAAETATAMAAATLAEAPVGSDESAAAETTGPAQSVAEAETIGTTHPEPPAETSLAARMEHLEPPPSTADAAREDAASPEAHDATASVAEAEEAPGAVMAEETPAAPEAAEAATAEEREPETAEAEPADTEHDAAPTQVDRDARSKPVASEPVLQRVVVGPNGNAAHEEPAETDEAESQAPKSPRRGWWQRQFGG